MKILCISDTHNKTNLSNLEPADLLLFAGDFSMMGKVSECLEFYKHIEAIKDRYRLGVYGTFGNHDYIGETDPGYARMLMDNVNWIIDEPVVIEGIRFFFFPYVPNLSRWAFYKSDKDMVEAVNKIPLDTQFLVTHSPPHGILDKIWDGQHVGNKALTIKLPELTQLKYLLCGHLHESYGEKEMMGIKYINACICDENYRAVNKPIVLEI